VLHLAAEKPPVPGGAPIRHVEGELVPLPIPEASIDATTGQQVIQFAPDPAAALGQMRTAIRDGGRLG